MNTLEKLRNIKPGEAVCYYTGVTPTAYLPNSERGQVFAKAYYLQKNNIADLVQKKLTSYNAGEGLNEFAYIAVGRKVGA